jgi:ABC-type phosphate/phosphonate transport system permease subunit
MNLFDYPKVVNLVGVIIIVLLVDRFSATVRRRLVT